MATITRGASSHFEGWKRSRYWARAWCSASGAKWEANANGRPRAAARLALAECASEALVECIRAGELVGDGVVGNAALAIGDLAKEGTGRDKFAALEPVKPLLAVCHKRTGAAQKNAAIACARLASHPKMLETLKANNGLELIYRYVQP